MTSLIQPDYQGKPDEVWAQYRISPLADQSFHQALESLGNSFHLGEHLHISDLNQDELSCKVYLPGELFEEGNICQHLSILAGSIFDECSVEALELLDIFWPQSLTEQLPGPQLGTNAIRSALDIQQRPLSSALLLPQTGQTVKQVIESSYHLWMAGIDIVMESSFMGSSEENDFTDRINYLSNEQKNCSKRTEQVKIYIPNITASTLAETNNRLQRAKEKGLSVVSLNGAQAGFLAIDAVRSRCTQLDMGLVITLPGVSQNASSKIHPRATAKIYRFMGADFLSMPKQLNATDQSSFASSLKNKIANAEDLNICWPMCSITNNELIPNLVSNLGYDLIIQAGEQVYRHPDGIKSGAQEFHEAILAASSAREQRKISGLLPELELEEEIEQVQ